MTEPGGPVFDRLPLDDLTPHPRNPREGDVGAIVESLRDLGQYRPIVAQRRAKKPYTILAGNQTWQALRVLRDEDPARWGEIDVMTVDVDDRTGIRIMLADNRTHDLGRDRPDELAALLRDLGEDGWQGTGWDGDDLDALLRDLGEWDPGGSIRDAFADRPAEGHEMGAVARDRDAEQFYGLHIPLTEVQRGIVLAAFKRAKADGYATQPEAIVAMAQKYTEGLPG